MVGGTKPGARDNIWPGIRTQVYCGDNSVCEADLEAPQYWSSIWVTQKQVLKLTSPSISSNLAGKNYHKDPACRDIFTTISNKTWVCRLETSKCFFKRLKISNPLPFISFLSLFCDANFYCKHRQLWHQHKKHTPMCLLNCSEDGQFWFQLSEHWFKRSHTVMNLQGKRENSQYCLPLKEKTPNQKSWKIARRLQQFNSPIV